jgi:hypothetical protein
MFLTTELANGIIDNAKGAVPSGSLADLNLPTKSKFELNSAWRASSRLGDSAGVQVSLFYL